MCITVLIKVLEENIWINSSDQRLQWLYRSFNWIKILLPSPADYMIHSVTFVDALLYVDIS